MVGVVQGLLASRPAAAAPPPPPPGNLCTSFDVSIACCQGVGICSGNASGASCPDTSGGGWTFDC